MRTFTMLLSLGTLVTGLLACDNAPGEFPPHAPGGGGGGAGGAGGGEGGEPPVGPSLSCDHDAHELPIVTHWNNDTDTREYLATDNINEERGYDESGPYQPGCHARWRLGREGGAFFPAYEEYVAGDYTERAIGDDVATALARAACADNGLAVQFLHPDVLDGGVDRERVAPFAQYLQVIHGVTINTPESATGSLATIALPPGWDPDAPPGTYPVIVHSYYDLNHSLFVGQNGAEFLRVVSEAAADGRKGAIGIIYNGNAGRAGYAHNESAYRHFGAVIDRVAALGGDRHRVLTYGGSRAGSTAFNFAANPYELDYTVVFAAGGAAAVNLKSLFNVFPSFTYAETLEVATEITGFHDAYREGWSYPACGRPELLGMSANQAALQIVFGADDVEALDTMGAYAESAIERMIAQGTKLYVDIGTADALAPPPQIDFAERLLRLGAEAEVSISVRGGHGGRRLMAAKTVEAVHALLDGGQPSVDAGLHYFVFNRDTGSYDPLTLPAGEHPFTMNAPYAMPVGLTTPLSFTGTPGTDYEARIEPPAGSTVAPLVIAGTIVTDPDTRSNTDWVTVPNGYPAGRYTYALRIRKPGEDWVTIDNTNTPAEAGTVATVEVIDALPNLSGDSLASLIINQTPFHPLVLGGTGWGISEL